MFEVDNVWLKIFPLQTGTLTQNVMTFKECSIDGQLYGKWKLEDGFKGISYLLRKLIIGCSFSLPRLF